MASSTSEGAAPPPSACLLPFPDKFHAAREFVEGLPKGSDSLSDDAWLALGALCSQATKGPCTEPRRWGLMSSSTSSSAAEDAAWRELGDMQESEAMRLYVRVLDEEAPGWWRAVGAVGAVGKGGGADGGIDNSDNDETDGERTDGDAASALGRWVRVSTTSPGPCPRYEHAAALLGRALFVAGGSRAGGRMLGDCHALDLERLSWVRASPPDGEPGALPPRAGLSLVPWRGKGKGERGCLLAVGGFAPRSGRGGPAPTETEVWRLDPAVGRWSLVPTTVSGGGGESGEPSPPPLPRGGHTVTVVPGTSRALVFGGEVFGGEGRGRAAAATASGVTDELYELDLGSMSWRGPLRVRGARSGLAPAPRSGHVAAAVGRYLVVFGGADGGDGLFGDLAVLDVDALEWVRPDVVVADDDGESESDGEGGGARRSRSRRKLVVGPRAGASAAVIGRTVFVAGGSCGGGGGDSKTLALDCSRLPRGPLVWRRAVSSDDDDGEGASPTATTSPSPAASEGLALVSLPRVGALLALGGNAGRLHANLEVLRPRSVAVSAADDDGDESGGEGESDEEEDGDAATATATSLPSPSPSSELALMRRQLASAQAAAADARQRAEDAEERLRSESERASRLEADLLACRRRLAAALNGDDDEEEEAGDVKPQQSRGPRVWAYISGAS